MKAILKFSVGLIIIIVAISCNIETEEPVIEKIYTKSVERISINDFEKNPIEKAESIYPERIEVMAAAVFSNIDIPETGYWYYNSFDGIQIPYAITIDAINYYTELIDDINSGKINTFFLKATFIYQAKVEFHDNYSIKINGKDDANEYKNVYVVDMNLTWEHSCGSLCGLWINKKRTVVFDQSGELQKVYYDGAEPVAVS
jgi:hypothetical protein